ncbi:MAG: HEPN domain-containing protein [Candidatus Woesearchaeota archaeon]
MFRIRQPLTFYSAVITHSYYAIFYAAKAYLARKGIITEPPEEHKKTYETYKELVEDGELDVELLRMYSQTLIKADTLLKIFETEKSKRGKFTYRRLPQANKEPAEQSVTHAKTFFKHTYNLLEARK